MNIYLIKQLSFLNINSNYPHTISNERTYEHCNDILALLLNSCTGAIPWFVLGAQITLPPPPIIFDYLKIREGLFFLLIPAPTGSNPVEP